MAYIGLPPKANFTSGLLDRFTSTTGTTVTLTHDISSENDIVVFVNFVKQDSTTYSVGGTGNKTLTLGGTLVSSDIVEVHYLNIVGQTNAPSAGSVTTATINDLAVTGAKLNTDVISAQTELASGVASTDELLISDAGVLKRVDVSLVGGTNTPAFEAYNNSSQSFSDNTNTKVEFDTEVFDSDGTFASNRFTPAVAGKYLIHSQTHFGTGSNTNLVRCYYSIYKNGSQYAMTNFDTRNGGNFRVLPNRITAIMDLDSDDYVEIYAQVDTASGSITSAGNTEKTLFGAYKIIGA